MLENLTPLVAFVPGGAWLWFLHRKDRLEPEPWRWVLLTFGLGCAAAGVQMALRPLVAAAVLGRIRGADDLLDAFVVTAAAEEFVKALPLVLFVLWHREMDEPLDGIIYGAAAGLGFASIENALYLSQTGALSVIPLRAFTATLAHATFSGLVGLCLATLRLKGRSKLLPCSVGVIGVVAAHGLYDLVLFAHPDLGPIALLGVLPLALIALSWRIRRGQRASRTFHPGL